jgi:hypothetical protein
MAYGLHPQLYPYLYAPKNPLSLPTYDPSESLPNRHKSSLKEKDEADDKSNRDEVNSIKDDDENAMDESENVEID